MVKNRLQDALGVLYSTAALARQGQHSRSFDQLAEEVMELHLALRGKHQHAPAMEWLEIASIALNALADLPVEEVNMAYALLSTKFIDSIKEHEAQPLIPNVE